MILDDARLPFQDYVIKPAPRRSAGKEPNDDSPLVLLGVM